MTGLVIAAGILLVVLLILAGRVTVVFDYGDELFLRVSYLFFTVAKIPDNSKKTAKKDKKVKKSAKKAAEDTEKSAEKDKKSEKSKPGISDIFALVKLAADSVGKPLKRVMKRTRISHLNLDIVCGGEDAAKAALNFGRMNILVGNVLGWIDSFFTLKSTKGINIGVDFHSEETVWAACGEVRLSLAAALALVFSVIGRALKHYGTHKDAKVALSKVLSK